jgi:fatty-acyl-CoA synthase
VPHSPIARTPSAYDYPLLINSEFLPILEQIRGRIDAVKGFVLLNDEPLPPTTSIPFCGEYESLLAAASPAFDFPDFDENTRATTFYTTGTTGMPKGVYFSHRQLVLHTMGVLGVLGSALGHGRFHRQDVYMPITPMFHVHAWAYPMWPPCWGSSRSIRGATCRTSYWN